MGDEWKCKCRDLETYDGDKIFICEACNKLWRRLNNDEWEEVTESLPYKPLSYRRDKISRTSLGAISDVITNPDEC